MWTTIQPSGQRGTDKAFTAYHAHLGRSAIAHRYYVRYNSSVGKVAKFDHLIRSVKTTVPGEIGAFKVDHHFGVFIFWQGSQNEIGCCERAFALCPATCPAPCGSHSNFWMYELRQGFCTLSLGPCEDFRK